MVQLLFLVVQLGPELAAKGKDRKTGCFVQVGCQGNKDSQLLLVKKAVSKTNFKSTNKSLTK